MREGYKMTELGEIPEDWLLGKLENFATKITDGSHYSPTPEANSGYLIATVKDMRNKEFDLSSCIQIPQKDFKLLVNNGCKPRRGDILFSKDGTIGKTFVFEGDYEIVLLSSIAIIRINSEIAIPEYLCQVLKSSIFFKQLAGLISGSAIRRLVLKAIKGIKVTLPTFPEQQKIATILSTVDKKIEVIEAQITHTSQLKKGLMQKLLTRGIGHTKFKGSVLGEIPESWKVDLLDNVSRRVSGHTPSKSFDIYYNGGIKWVSLADSSSLDNGLIFETKFNISEAGVRNSSAVVHPKGTVLMSRDASVGKSAVMGEEMAVSQHFMAWICEEKLNNWYLYYLLQFKKEYFERIAVGSTIKTIGLPIFKKIQIPVPPVSEQNQIATILNTVGEKLNVLQTKKETFQQLKKALMQQLLTGKVRVVDHTTVKEDLILEY